MPNNGKAIKSTESNGRKGRAMGLKFGSFYSNREFSVDYSKWPVRLSVHVMQSLHPAIVAT